MCLGVPISVGGEMVYTEVVADRRAIRVLPLPGGSFRRYGRGLSRTQMVASSCRTPFGAGMGGPHPRLRLAQIIAIRLSGAGNTMRRAAPPRRGSAPTRPAMPR